MMIGVQNDPAERLPERLARLEHLIARDLTGHEPAGHAHAGHDLVVPAWRRHTDGEQRWPSGVAILCMIALQVALPDRLTIGPRWLMPAIEVVIIGVLIAANPGKMTRQSSGLRMAGLGLIAVASVSNAWSVAVLVTDIARNQHTGTAA